LRASREIKLVAVSLRLWLFFLLNELIRLLIPRRRNSATLVIRLDAIGDFIIWLGSGADQIAKLARQQGRSVLLAGSDWADFARSLQLFDEVWPVETARFERRPCYRFLLQTRIRRAGFSIVIQPKAARNFLLEDSVIRVSGAESVTGAAGSKCNIASYLKRISDRWYTRLVDALPASSHESEKNRAFCRAVTGAEAGVVSLDFDPSIAPRLGVTQDYFLIAPGAGHAGRRWPVARFVDIAMRLQLRTGLLCVVVGGAEDKPLAEAIRDTLGSRCRDLAGKTTLMETGALLKNARLAIANESAVAHFATLLGTRAVVLLGGGHFGRFMPYGKDVDAAIRPIVVFQSMDCYGCNWQCCFPVANGGTFPCVERISVEEVWLSVVAACESNRPPLSDASAS
jgi:ADP-heptose:LPS heptosyltransferase